MKKDFKLPSPADLAKKEEMSNISLRLKQSTIDIFDMLAKDNNSKPATMMTSLLDMYANNYRENKSDDESLTTEIIKNFLKKAANKIKRMDKSEALLAFSKMKERVDEACELAEVANFGELEYCLEGFANGKADKFHQLSPCIIFGDGSYYCFDLMCAKKGEMPRIEEGDRIKGDSYEDFLYIPADKWIVTALILGKYDEKMRSDMPNLASNFTEKMVHEFLNLAEKEKDDVKYIDGLVEILVKFIEGQND